VRQISTDAMIIGRSRDRSNLMRQWENLPDADFRKSRRRHARRRGPMFEHLTQGAALPEGLDAGASCDPRKERTGISTRCHHGNRAGSTLAMSQSRRLDGQSRNMARARGELEIGFDTRPESLICSVVEQDAPEARVRGLVSAGSILGGIEPEGRGDGRGASVATRRFH